MRSPSAATVTVTVIATPMGLHVHFEDVAVRGARNFLQRLTAIGTAFLVVG
jgi:hypothetical protein